MMPEKKNEEANEDWISTYSDMVTLLLTFFIMLLAASKVDAVLFEQIKNGISKEWYNKDVEQPLASLRADLSDDLASVSTDADLALGKDQSGLTLEIPAKAFFKVGSAELLPKAKTILMKILSTLKAPRYNMFRFEVQGHSDDQRIKTSQYPSNWELSAARAAAVVRFFESNGIPSPRLKATGMADVQPKYPNRDAYGQPIPINQERNRRVVIRMEPSFLP